jgi:glycosyltransferase involved in cell wall biosynthesis
MKVYYIGGSYESCYYVRCLQPLQANGWDGDKISLASKRATTENMIKGAMNADIVVFHRPIKQEMYDAAVLLKEAGKKIVMDNDDTYRENSGVPVQMFGKDRDDLNKAINHIDSQLKKFAQLADLVTVSTEYLKKEYETYCKNVEVLTNCVDPFDWDEPAKNDTGKTRLLITGSVASNKDYEPIIPLLNNLKGRDDVQIVLQALPADKPELKEAREMYKPELDFWKQYNVEWIPFMSLPEYLETIPTLKIDIMLIPRHDNYFNRCKSNLKFLEASMAKMATVAQSFPDGQSPYEVDKEDTENLILATTQVDWCKKVLDLLDNKEKIDILKEKSFNYVSNKYDINKQAYKWKQTYKKLYE